MCIGRYWTKDPPARTTVVVPLLNEGLVEISAVAVPDGGERVVVNPSGWMVAPNPYSYGIKSGNTLFLAGLISRNGKDNAAIKGDMAAQTKTVMDNGAAVLKAAGMSLADVVSSRIYITDTAAFQEMNTAYRTYFPTDPPARATVKAQLTSADYIVEITMVAVKSSNRTAVTTPAADGTPGAKNANLSSAIRAGNRLVRVGHSREYRGEQGRCEGADRRGAGAHRPHAQGRRLRLEPRRRRHGLSARPDEVRRYERLVPGAAQQRTSPRARPSAPA